MIGPPALVAEEFVAPSRAEAQGVVLRPLKWTSFPLLCSAITAGGDDVCGAQQPHERDSNDSRPPRTTPDRAALMAASERHR